MNGCGGESIAIEVEANLGADEDYDTLYVKAISMVSEYLPGRAIHRERGDCGGVGGLSTEPEEWYVGCAHCGVSAGGRKLTGRFTFIKHGSEGSF